jgi:hypothetical protein
MTSEAKPCPFYGIPCEYVPMAEKADAQAARIEQLEAALRKITDRLEDDFNDGRPMRRYELEKARAALEASDGR